MPSGAQTVARITGRYGTTVAGGEEVWAAVPHPLPPTDPPLDMARRDGRRTATGAWAPPHQPTRGAPGILVTAATLRLAPTREMGSLRVAAELQDTVVYAEPDAPEVLRGTEGAVDLALHFPDRSAVHRFVRRVAALRLPP